MEVQLFISPPDLAFNCQRIRKLELLFFAQLFFWLRPQEGKAARGALESCCPSSEQGVGAAGCKERLQSVIQVGQHSRHQTHNELGVNSLHYKLELSGAYKSAATSNLATWFCYTHFSSSMILLFFFFWKIKRKLLSPWGKRTGHFWQDTAQQKLEEFHENEKSSLQSHIWSLRPSSLPNIKVLQLLPLVWEYIMREKRVKEFFIIIESIWQPKYRDSYQFLYNTMQRHLN